MRRAAALMVTGALAAALLAACGPSSQSFNDGYAVGWSKAAALGPGALDGRAALPLCRRQWTVSGPATDTRSVWIRGCVDGAHKLEATLSLPARPVPGRWAAPALR